MISRVDDVLRMNLNDDDDDDVEFSDRPSPGNVNGCNPYRQYANDSEDGNKDKPSKRTNGADKKNDKHRDRDNSNNERSSVNHNGTSISPTQLKVSKKSVNNCDLMDAENSPVKSKSSMRRKGDGEDDRMMFENYASYGKSSARK